MKNIAILITGLTRNYKETFDSFQKNIIEPNIKHNIDIYLSFWNKTHNRSFNKDLKDGGYDDIVSTENNKHELLELYSPKKFVENNFDIHDTTLRYQSEKLYEKKLNFVRNFNFLHNSFFGQLYSWKKAIELIPEETNYDIVLKIRFDSLFYHPINLDSFNLSMFNSGAWHNTFINDFVFLSNKKNMCFLMNELYNSLLRDDIVEYKDEFLPEKYITYMLKKNGIQINNKAITTHIKR